ncbi:unnamed protein product [Prunus armeniaca]
MRCFVRNLTRERGKRKAEFFWQLPEKQIGEEDEQCTSLLSFCKLERKLALCRGFGGSTSSFPAVVQWELPLLGAGQHFLVLWASLAWNLLPTALLDESANLLLHVFSVLQKS